MRPIILSMAPQIILFVGLWYKSNGTVSGKWPNGQASFYSDHLWSFSVSDLTPLNESRFWVSVFESGGRRSGWQASDSPPSRSLACLERLKSAFLRGRTPRGSDEIVGSRSRPTTVGWRITEGWGFRRPSVLRNLSEKMVVRRKLWLSWLWKNLFWRRPLRENPKLSPARRRRYVKHLQEPSDYEC